MTESTYRSRVVSTLRSAKFLAEGFEVISQTGVPDVWYAPRPAWRVVPALRVPGWIELKIARGRKVELTQAQVRWLERANLRGVPTWVLAYYRGTHFLWPGSRANEVLEHGIDAPGVVVVEDLATLVPYLSGEVEVGDAAAAAE